MTSATGLTDVLDQIDGNSDGEKLKIQDMVEALKHRGYGPLMLAPALLTLMPTGAIPGVPAFSALLIILIAAQLVIGRSSPWIPKKLGNRSIEKEKFEKAREKIEPYTKKIDTLIKPRLHMLSGHVMNRLIAGLCLILALLMPPLEMVPFAAAVPALAIALFGVGLSARDGLFILCGLMISLVGAGLFINWLL